MVSVQLSVKNDDRLLSKKGVAFHLTESRRAEQILNHGFDPQYIDYQDSPEELFCQHIAAQRGEDLPIDRSNASFFFLSPECTRAQNPVDESVVVVNLDALSGPMCVADMALFDAVIERVPYDWPNSDPVPQSAIEAADAYIASMQTVTSRREMQEVVAGYACPELIVGGTINPESILTTISPNWNHSGEAAVWEFQAESSQPSLRTVSDEPSTAVLTQTQQTIEQYILKTVTGGEKYRLATTDIAASLLLSPNLVAGNLKSVIHKTEHLEVLDWAEDDTEKIWSLTVRKQKNDAQNQKHDETSYRVTLDPRERLLLNTKQEGEFSKVLTDTGFDVKPADVQPTNQHPFETILRTAARTNRILLTPNPTRTNVPISQLAEWIPKSVHHHGIVLLPNPLRTKTTSNTKLASAVEDLTYGYGGNIQNEIASVTGWLDSTKESTERR